MSDTSKDDKQSINIDIWKNLDLEKVKQRIDNISAKLEAVLRKNSIV
jgi:tetrahydromethanopterin S-methyltransferase subunit G